MIFFVDIYFQLKLYTEKIIIVTYLYHKIQAHLELFQKFGAGHNPYGTPSKAATVQNTPKNAVVR